jgi:hypothetical protein
MKADRSLEWVQSMRTMILGSLFNLSSRHLQAASWTNPNNDNPAYSLVEFVNESFVNDIKYLGTLRDDQVINDSEYAILLRLAQAIAAYSPPGENWYDHDAVLRDPKWHAVTETADSVLNELLSLSFNSPGWLGK